MLIKLKIGSKQIAALQYDKHPNLLEKLKNSQHLDQNV